MKALKSELGKALLADPAARDKLRTYMVTRKLHVAGGVTTEPEFVIEVPTRDGRTRRVTPVIVPKAA
jgi:hypothetical protein